MFCVARIPPKVLRKMVEIWYVVVDWTNLQLIVLKILMVVFMMKRMWCEVGW